MYAALLKYVLALPPEQLPTVQFEEMILCAQWRETARNAGTPIPEDAEFTAALDRWMREAAPPERETEGFRQQPLLRELLRLADSAALNELSRDELDFLAMAHTLAEKVTHPRLAKRPAARLASHMHAIQRRIESLPPDPAMASIPKRLTIVTPEAIAGARRADACELGGVPCDISGPVFRHEGRLKLVADLAKGYTVMVSGGSCTVRGDVLGNVLADGCEVQGAIAGVAVAPRGDIRAGQLAPGSIAVAKQGALRCTSATQPRIAFAAKTLRVGKRAYGGTYVGHNIEIAGEMQSAVCHAAHRAHALRFTGTPQRPMNIVLRRALNCTDYEQHFADGARNLLDSAFRMRRRFALLRELEAAFAKSADAIAGGIIWLLLSGGDMSEQLDMLERTRRRVLYVNCVEAVLKSIVLAVEDYLTLLPNQGKTDLKNMINVLGTEESLLLDDMDRDLAALGAEGPIEPDMTQCRENAIGQTKALFQTGNDRKAITAIRNLLERLTEVALLREKLTHAAVERQKALDAAMKSFPGIERARTESTRVGVLWQLLGSSRDRDELNAIRKRANTKEIQASRERVEARLARVRQCHEAMEALRGEFDSLRVRLEDEFRVACSPDFLEAGIQDGARVRGGFAGNVHIYAHKHLLQAARPSDPGVLVPPNTNGGVIAYRRTIRGTIEIVPE